MLLKDPSLKHWIGKKDYFKGVNEIMKRIMPNASDKQRTKQARDWYQQDVINYIKFNQETVFKNIAKTLIKLKDKFTLALITTNTKEHIHQILEAANLKGIYDIIFATSSSEKPDKADLFQKFSKQYGNPKYYFASRSKEAFEECLKLGSICVYVTWDELNSEIEKLADKTINNEKEMEQLLI